MARTVEFPTALTTAVNICAQQTGVTGNQFIKAAVEAAVKTLTDNDARIRSIVMLSIDAKVSA
jgi:hypothetical protein